VNALVVVALALLMAVPCAIGHLYIKHLERQIKDLIDQNDRLTRDIQGLMESLCAANGQKVSLERKSERIEQMTKIADKAIVGVPYFARGNGDAVMQSQMQWDAQSPNGKK
jgi:hypothetical protein